MTQYDQRGQQTQTQYNVGRDLNIVVPPVSQVTALEQSNRKIVLDRVEQIWIQGLLEKSLYKQVQILLDLHERPHAVNNPWHFVVQELVTSTAPLPPELSIQGAYDHAGGALLLLGEPGAGKTTLLLELLRTLLQRAHQDSGHQIPIIFNLSSWTSRRLPLDRWFVEELNSKYQIPRPLAQTWVKQNAILPLLDGLDEVIPQARAACVDTINVYRDSYGLTPLIVCCRITEYEELIAKTQEKLRLHTAVQIQPLTPQHINTYLSDAGPTLSALNTAIQQNPMLQELVTTPLMLSVLSLAYQGASPEEIQVTDERQVFDLYVQRMLARRGIRSHYTAEETKKWLTRLAQQMMQHGQTEFYLEQLQKDWFPHEQIYRLCIGLIFSIIVGFFIFFTYGATFFFDPISLSEKMSSAFIFAIFNSGILMLLYGFVFNIVGNPTNSNPIHPAQRVLLFIRKQLIRLLDNRIFYGLLIGVADGLFLLHYLDFWPPYAFLHALFLSIGYMLVGRVDTDIRPVEAIQWSWRRAPVKLIKLFGGGLFCGLLFGLTTEPVFTLLKAYRYNDVTLLTNLLSSQVLTYSLLVVGVSGCTFGIIFTLIGGVSYVSLDKTKRIAPNQGIHSSLRNSLVLSLSTGPLVGLITALFFGPISAQINQMIFGIYSSFADVLIGVAWGIGCGIAMFAVVSLRNGGLACVQHFLLRFLLWRRGVLAWHTIRFLDEAASRILLYKVGGGYRFIHQSFLAYFASLAPTPTPVPVTVHASQEAPVQAVKAEWFFRLGLIAFLVFSVPVGWYSIDSYLYRSNIDHVMATSPYPRAFPGHGKINLYDPLSESNQWDNSLSINCQYLDNAYHILTTPQGLSTTCWSKNSFSNFAFTVNMTIIKRGCGGIFGAYYEVDICSDGIGYYYVGQDASFYSKININNDKHIMNTGLNQPNRLGVVLRKDTLSLFINDRHLKDLDASLLPPFIQTYIGLTAISFTQAPTEVAYTDAKVWTF